MTYQRNDTPEPSPPGLVVSRVVQVTEIPAAQVAELVAIADALRDLTLQPDFSKSQTAT